MTENAKICLNFLNEVGIAPNSFDKECATLLQQLVALYQEGWCDDNYIKSHIFPDKPALMNSAYWGVANRKRRAHLLQKLGLNPSLIHRISSDEYIQMVANAICIEAGTDIQLFDEYQQFALTAAYEETGNTKFPLLMCDHRIPEEVMAGILRRATKVN